MTLEPVLDVYAIDDTQWSVVSAGEKECPEGLRSEAGVVCAPDHGGVHGGIGLFEMEEGGMGGREVTGVESACWERPEWRARPARKAGPLETINMCMPADEGILTTS